MLARQVLYCVPSVDITGHTYWWRLVDVGLNVLIMGPFLEGLKEKFPHCDFQEVNVDWNAGKFKDHFYMLTCTRDEIDE